LSDLGIGRRTILKWIYGVGCMGLTPNRDQWQVLVNTVMNLRVQ